MRIVLVEDNLSLAKGIENALKDQGHAVDHLDDGLDADAFLSRQRADVAIIDVNLPRLSGIEIIRRARARRDTIPMLILTARGKTSERVEGLDAGADDYLVKPFDMAELIARLRALARRRPEVALAREHGLDPAQMALAFCLTRPFLTSVIVGATSLAQLKTDMAAADIKLSPEVLAGIGKLHRLHPAPI